MAGTVDGRLQAHNKSRHTIALAEEQMLENAPVRRPDYMYTCVLALDSGFGSIKDLVLMKN